MVLCLEKLVVCTCIILIAGISGKVNKTTDKNFFDYYSNVVDKFADDINKIDANNLNEFIEEMKMIFFRKDIYRTLKVKPWITLEELELKFVNITNDTYSEDAYNELKEHLIERGPIPMSYVIGEYLCNITILICVFLVIYFIVYVVYFLFELFYVLLMSEIIGFIIIGNFFTNLF